jgi:hypothetical protein
VEAVQGNDVSAPDKTVAGFCHFPGQSQPVGGLERGAMEISENMLREIFLPSWEAGIKKGGALGVTATYPAIDGVPTHASEWILTDILRGELGFRGLVLGEGPGVRWVKLLSLATEEQEERLSETHNCWDRSFRTLPAVRHHSRFTKAPLPEQIETTIWHPEMLKLPEEETRDGYPLWRRVGFWFSILTLLFTIIYALFW